MVLLLLVPPARAGRFDSPVAGLHGVSAGDAAERNGKRNGCTSSELLDGEAHSGCSRIIGKEALITARLCGPFAESDEIPAD